MTRATTVSLAIFFTVVQFYTSLAALSPTPPVGYTFASQPVAALLVAALVAAGAMLLVRLVRERAAVPPSSAALLGAWIGAAALSSALGVYPAAGFQVVGIMLLTAIFHVALVRFYPQPGVARTLLATYLATGLSVSLAALAMVVARRPAELWALNHGRAAGVFITANQFAAYLIAFVFIALGAALASAGGLRRLAVAAAAAGGIALVATVSLGGLLGAAAAAVFYAVASGARRTAVAIALVVVLGVVVLAVRPAVRHNPAESLDRLRIWQAGVRVAELFPLTGVGPMAYFKIYPAIRPPNGDLPGTFGALHPHDVYLSLAAETGAIGLVAAAFGWYRFAGAFRAGIARLDANGKRFALGTAAALVAVLVQGVFDTVGVVEMAFVWIPYTGLALAAAASGMPGSGRERT